MSANQDRYGITIRGKYVMHSTAQRDYVCSCGYGVSTKYMGGEWRTVCTNDPTHDPDEWIHKNAVGHVQFRNMVAELEAREVWEGLPLELREAIERREDAD